LQDCQTKNPGQTARRDGSTEQLSVIDGAFISPLGYMDLALTISATWLSHGLYYTRRKCETFFEMALKSGGLFFVLYYKVLLLSKIFKCFKKFLHLFVLMFK
jgi:hypothetical protein